MVNEGRYIPPAGGTTQTFRKEREKWGTAHGKKKIRPVWD